MDIIIVEHNGDKLQLIVYTGEGQAGTCSTCTHLGSLRDKQRREWSHGGDRETDNQDTHSDTHHTPEYDYMTCVFIAAGIHLGPHLTENH